MKAMKKASTEPKAMKASKGDDDVPVESSPSSMKAMKGGGMSKFAKIRMKIKEWRTGTAKKAAAEKPPVEEAVEAPADEPEVAESEESSAGV
jgi:hypothetical protein